MSPAAPSPPLLRIEGLTVAVGRESRAPPAVDGLSLDVRAGEVVALVGESGSGKSMTARAVIGLLPPGARIAGGAVRFDGEDLTAMTQHELDSVRGRRIGMLFQQPRQMLDPTCRVGTQVVEALRHHRRLPRADAEARAIALLREVGIADPERRMRAYAYELSGGMAQRVMMAAALSSDPDLLIADEPTTALDVTVQAQIMRMLDEQRRKRRLAILLISHDLPLVSVIASRVAVMYAGRILEEGPTERVLRAPRHPYTRKLVDCSLLRPGAGAGGAGRASARPNPCGCRYHSRCEVDCAAGHDERCAAAEPELTGDANGVSVRCWACAARQPPA
jgi:peptide/nickel transport system ATP-binding protein